jgi:hypothetical protein
MAYPWQREENKAMTTQDEAMARGRKVFFLYPHSVLNEELLIEILSHEYEVYSLRNHDAAVTVAAVHPGSIFFVNIDEALEESKWEAWIRQLLSQPETSAIKVGIMTYNPNAELARKYLIEMMVPCGFIQLKIGLAESKSIILKTLEANEARGRRRYVRARCSDARSASLNVKMGKRVYSGSILDISAAGMTFRLDTPTKLKPQTVLEDIQLRLKGTLCRVTGIYIGAAQGTVGGHLLMFGLPMEEEITKKIHRFVFHSLQEEMDTFVRNQARYNKAQLT